MPRYAATVVVLAAAVAQADAVAERRHAAVHWVIDPSSGCPDGPAMQQEVAAHLGYDPFDGPSQLTLDVSLRRSGNQYQAVVSLQDPSGKAVGEKRLDSEAPDCRELSASVALAMSLAIDPQSFGGPTLPAPPPPTPAPPPAAKPTPPPAVPSRFAFDVGGFGILGASPRPSAGLTIGAALRRPSFSLELEGEATLTAGIPLGAASADTALYAGAFLACGSFTGLGFCGRISVGAEQASGQGLTDPATGLPSNASLIVPYFAAGAQLRYDFPLWGEVLLRPFINGDVAIVQTRLLVNGVGVWTMPPIVGSAGVALLWVTR